MECLERAIEVYILEIELPLQVFQDMELQGDCFLLQPAQNAHFMSEMAEKHEKRAPETPINRAFLMWCR